VGGVTDLYKALAAQEKENVLVNKGALEHLFNSADDQPDIVALAQLPVDMPSPTRYHPCHGMLRVRTPRTGRDVGQGSAFGAQSRGFRVQGLGFGVNISLQYVPHLFVDLGFRV
jgi:hypothetical protein